MHTPLYKHTLAHHQEAGTKCATAESAPHLDGPSSKNEKRKQKEKQTGNGAKSFRHARVAPAALCTRSRRQKHAWTDSRRPMQGKRVKMHKKISRNGCHVLPAQPPSGPSSLCQP